VRKRQRAFPITGEDRLGIGEDGRAGGRIAGVADRYIAGQRGEDALSEDVGDETHPAMRACDPGAVDRNEARRLLAAVLEAIQAEVGDTRCVRNASDTDNATHLLLSLPCVEE